MGTDYAAPPSYDAARSMSALAAFNWVHVCAQRKSLDLALLPLRVKRFVGEETETISDHPLTELLAKPNPGTSGSLFRQQLWIDRMLTGNAYVLLEGTSAPAVRPPSALWRLHPSHVRVIADDDGTARAYEYTRHDGQRTTYAPQLIVHWRGPSWRDDARGLTGTGVIESLDRMLTAERELDVRSTASARQGRPAFLLSPGSSDDAWSSSQVSDIMSSIRSMFDKAHGGAGVIGRQATLEKLDWSMSDLEYGATKDRNRDAIMASFGVTPSIVGIRGANYATARQEEVTYWQGLRADASTFEAAFRSLCRALGESTDRLYHDTSEVPALQYDRGERLARVQSHIANGIPPQSAYAYEGFDDAPEVGVNGIQIQQAVSIAQGVAASMITPAQAQALLSMLGVAPEVAGVIASEDAAGSAAFDLGSFGEPATDPGPSPAPPSPSTGADDDPEAAAPARAFWPVRRLRLSTDDERSDYWKQWAAKIQTPGEVAVQRAVAAMLVRQRARYAARVGDVLGNKAIAESLLIEVLSAGSELAEVTTTVRPLLERIVRRAMLSERVTLGVPIRPAEDSTRVQEMIRRLIGQTQSTTEARVQAIIERGTAEGLSVTDIQSMIQEDAFFGPGRSRMIARTGATRSANEGAVIAYDQAVEEHGVSIDGTGWLSSRDSSVRDDHRDLDGQTVPLGGKFTIERGEDAGRTAPHPGSFELARQDINCRCTVIPILGDD